MVSVGKTNLLLKAALAECGEKPSWISIGAARDHENAKGMTVQLDLVPVGLAAQHAVDGRRVRIVDAAARRGDPDRRQLVGVEHVDADYYLITAGEDQPRLMVAEQMAARVFPQPYALKTSG